MGEFNLNLSTRPFPAYRVANVALFLFFLVIAGVSVWQMYSYRSYSGRAKSIRAEEQTAQIEKKSLDDRLEKLTSSLDRPVTTAKLNEIDYLNDLIVQKHFSWTQVFANLEGVIPDNVHLVSVSPDISKIKGQDLDKVTLKLETMCRSISDESEFIRRLQASPVFQDVIVEREEQKSQKDTKDPKLQTAVANAGDGAGDINVSMTVSYFPQREPQ